MNAKLSGPTRKLVKKSSGRAPWQTSSATYNKTVREAPDVVLPSQSQGSAARPVSASPVHGQGSKGFGRSS